MAQAPSLARVSTEPDKMGSLERMATLPEIASPSVHPATRSHR
jgi:hypothetical protein